MAGHETLARKVSFVEERLERLRKHASVSREDFLKGEDLQDVVLHNLQLAIQGCIDLGSHIVSEQGWGAPGSFSEVFRIMQKHGLVPEDLGLGLVEMVGFRNRIVHGYEDIDLEIVYDVWRNRVTDIEEYLARVSEYFGL